MPILEVVEKEWIDCMSLLLEYGAHVNSTNPIGLLTAASVNARNGRVDVLRLLTFRGADFNVATAAGVTLFMRACLYGRTVRGGVTYNRYFRYQLQSILWMSIRLMAMVSQHS